MSTEFDFDESEIEAHNAIESATRAVKRQTYLSGDDPEVDQDDLNEVSDQVVTQTLKSVNGSEQRDVFDDVYNQLKPKLGQSISCRIYRNSELIGSVKDNSYSWERLIEEFGSKFGTGLYKVAVRNKGQFAGQEEQQLNVEKVESKEPVFDPMNFLKEMKHMQNETDLRNSEKEESMKNENGQVMKSMMEGMQSMMQNQMQSQMALMTNQTNQNNNNNSGSELSTMMLEMQKMNMAMIEKISSDQKETMREMRTEFKDVIRGLETQITNNNNKSDDSNAFNPLQFFQIMKENENSAVDNLLRMQEIAKASAVVVEPKDESMTDKALKMLPAILGGLNKAPALPLQNNPTSQRGTLPRRRTNPTRVKPSTPRSSTVRQESPTIVNEQQVKPIKVAPQVIDVEVKRETVEAPIEVAVETAPVENTANSVILDEGTAVALNELIIPIVLNGIMEESKAEETAFQVKSVLKGRFAQEIIDGIAEVYSLENIENLCDQAGLFEMASAQGRLQELKIWLGDLHYALRNESETNDEEFTESEEL